MSKIKEIISRMTLEDKVAFCSGADFWHTKAMSQYEIPEMMLSDGPSGIRKQERASAQEMLGINKSVLETCFPSASTTASSFDPAVTECIGRYWGRGFGTESWSCSWSGCESETKSFVRQKF